MGVNLVGVDLVRGHHISVSPGTVLCGSSCRNLAETLELLEKQVQCPICLEAYRDPKALACLHAYCQECIQRLLLRQQRDQEVECPQCRSVVAVAGNDPSSLPTVFFINGLIEVYQNQRNTYVPSLCSMEVRSELKSAGLSLLSLFSPPSS